MIELVSDERCIRCDLCVEVCPTNVFDAIPDAPPLVARKQDCQTCFMCEAYCPADALYVAANADESVVVSEAELKERWLGSYRQAIGWNKAKPHAPSAELEQKLHDFRKLNTRLLASGR